MKPAFEHGDVRIFGGDVLELLPKFPEKYFHCVVTSPPYWGLRDYGVGEQIGLESSPDQYIRKMVEVFREVWRVLRDDGTLWLNMGDSYCSGASSVRPSSKNGAVGGSSGEANQIARNGIPPGLKPKDLIGMPWMLALALRADGWYLRSDIIWSKPAPMPESVTDRPTKAHEYIFLLTKSEKYFYDHVAIREKVTGNAHARGTGLNPKAEGKNELSGDRRREGFNERWRTKQNESFSLSVNDLVSMRNKRTVWEVASYPFPEAHFATFPPDLIKPCILAGTSEHGCCGNCGAPWLRIIEKKASTMNVRVRDFKADRLQKKSGHTRTDIPENAQEYGDEEMGEMKTLGWKPSCKCNSSVIAKCRVLDPFMGSGTTALVAQANHCEATGIELNPAYIEIAKRRLAQDVLF